MLIVELTFIICLAIISLLGLYPLIAWFMSLVYPDPVRYSDDFEPPVSIIIACYNEEKFIKQKIDSFLSVDEWISGSEIIVISNGSTDSTNQILQEYAGNPWVNCIILEGIMSKIGAVNRGVQEAKHEIIVFSDCRQVMKPGSVRKLVRNFSDPEVGTVNSTLVDASTKGVFSLRLLLNFIADCESKSGSSLNIYGALYAQRKSVFREFPTDILFDDLFVVVSTVNQKKRLIAEKNAVIYDIPFGDYYAGNRIERLARGLLLFLYCHFGMLRRLPLLIFLRFIVFKYFKLLLPFVSAIILVDAILIFDRPFRFGYLLFYTLIVFATLSFRKSRVLAIQFFKINYYFFMAVLRFLFFNKRSITWDKLPVSKPVYHEKEETVNLKNT